MDGKKHNEGEIYKTITVSGVEFAILYGYYSESERELGFPIPILPDFEAEPVYASCGRPYVTRIQDACEHYAPKRGVGDNWCADCRHYPDSKSDIGVCQCEQRKKF